MATHRLSALFNLCVLISSPAYPASCPSDGTMQIASLLSEPCYAFRVGHRSMSSVRCPADRSLHPTRHRIDRHKRYGVDTEKQKKKK